MTTETIANTFIPELGLPTKGKVRDVYDCDDTIVMVTSDRISIFDEVLDRPVVDKGRVLTGLSMYWFDKTKDIMPNHVVSHPDPNVIVAQKCRPLMVEVIVRGYLAGSAARDYAEGSREKCGVTLPDGLKEGDPLPYPIVTPTTKATEGHDEDVSAEALIADGVVTSEQWAELEKKALELFERGQTLANAKGLILVDTKYEFGLDDQGNVVLIDEVHTPDSSRYWFSKEYDQQQLRFPDKELVRQWGLSSRGNGGVIPDLPVEVAQKATDGYREVYKAITGAELEASHQPPAARMVDNLKNANLIRGYYAVVISGSEKDAAHVAKITDTLTAEGVPFGTVVASAHKSTKQVMDLLEQYNQSIEPVVFITVAGRSNALSGVVAANTRWPVIACPPFKDQSDYQVNVHSSLQMPSHVPVMTVVDPGNAALSAARILRAMELTV